MLRLLGSLRQPLEPAVLRKCLLLLLAIAQPAACCCLCNSQLSSLGSQKLGMECTALRPRPPVSGNSWLEIRTALGVPGLSDSDD